MVGPKWHTRIIRLMLLFGGTLLAFEFVTPSEFPCSELYKYSLIMLVVVSFVDVIAPSITFES